MIKCKNKFAIDDIIMSLIMIRSDKYHKSINVLYLINIIVLYYTITILIMMIMMIMMIMTIMIIIVR